MYAIGLRVLSIAILLAAASVSHAAAAPDEVRLTSDWSLQTSAKVGEAGARLSDPAFKPKDWYPTAVPTTVLAALEDNGVYPDLYHGLNLKSVPGYQDGLWLVMPDDSPFDDSWWFQTRFKVPAGFAGKQVSLHLDGLNFKANVWLNGTLVADSDDVYGMFRRFQFDVSALVVPGKANALAIEIIPPGQIPDDDYHTKQIEGTIGWDDHNPQPPDMSMGIWQDVFLRATGSVRLTNPYVHSDLNVPTLDWAGLKVWADLENTLQKTQVVQVTGRIGDIEFTQEVRLRRGESRPVLFAWHEFAQLGIDNPRVWWPNPLGPQEMYDLELTCTVDGVVTDTASTRFGIREITSYINKEGWRQFVANGKPILIRGGAWMTSDMLLRLTDRRYDGLVRYAKEANLNMLRSEGFSIRETDAFYSICDEYGVMVTQQIFGRSIPDEDLAIACTKDTILRIRNHPSLVHFLGHDETFPTANLDATYRGLIDKYCPDRTYQPHSGAFDVDNRFLTGGTRTGTRELWTYANPKHYYEQKIDGAWGFAQSGGIGGIVAPFESVRRFIPEDQRWPLWTDALSFHSVTQGGKFFTTVVNMLDARYGECDGLEEFCGKAQVLNYECARGMYEAYGRNKGYASGITTWKYDVAWPAFMTWGYVDWYLNATGAYYGAKKACESVHVQYAYDDESVHVVSNVNESLEGLKVSAALYNLDASEQWAASAVVDALPGHAVARGVIAVPRPAGLSKSHFLRLTLDDADGSRLSDNFYWLSTVPDERGDMNEDWRAFWVKPKSIADHTDLNSLPPAKVAVSSAIRADGDEQVAGVTVRNPSDAIAFFIRLAAHKGADGDEVTPAFWSENCFSLLPGESRTVECRFYPRDLDGADPVIKVGGWNSVTE
ncbi:MAG: hypothetical protein GY851_34535 [bacterium]|nr:hypothetical protein [bacterium]